MEKSLDFQQIAMAHHQCLPSSTLSLCGTAVLERFYIYISQSKYEKVFIHESENKLGVGVISEKSNTLLKRFLIHNIFIVGFHIIISFIFNKRFRKVAFSKVIHRDDIPLTINHRCVELVILFVDVAMRGRGIGGQIINEIDEFLVDCNIDSYYVKTINQEFNQALVFYRKHGFKCIGKGSESGKNYVFFEKKLVLKND